MGNRIVYVAQYFTPEPYLKDITFIKDLQKKGWDPLVVTAYPNYPKGKIYAGYKNKLFSVEQLEGIKVIRVKTYPYHGTGAVRRILNYLAFAVFSSIAVVRWGRSASIYYILQSSPLVLLTAWTIRIIKRNAKILLDVQDIFPENIRISGIIRSPKFISFIDFILNNFYYKAFDCFIVVSKSFKEVLVKKNIPADNVAVVYNWSMVEFKEQVLIPNRPAVFEHGFLHVVYAGNIGINQGLSTLIQGFKQIKEVGAPFRFHFFGDGTDFSQLRKKLNGMDEVVFHGRVPADEIGQYLANADVLFLHLVKDPAYKYIIPSKLQAYIQFGKPILAGLEGEAKEIVEANGLGVVFEPENNAEFIRSLKMIINYSSSSLEKIRKESEALYQLEFSRKAGVEKIDQFLQQCHES